MINKKCDSNECDNSSDLHLDHIYNVFAFGLVKNATPVTEFGSVIDMVKEMLEEAKLNQQFNLKDVYLGGISGYDHIRYEKHVDVVVVLNEPVSRLKIFIEQFHYEIRRLKKVYVKDMTMRSVLFKCDGINVDLVSMPKSGIVQSEEFSQDLGAAGLQHIASVIQVARLLNQCLYEKDYIPGRLTTIEFLAMKAAFDTSKTGNLSVIKSINKFLDYVDELTTCKRIIAQTISSDHCFEINLSTEPIKRLLFAKLLFPANLGMTTDNIDDLLPQASKNSIYSRNKPCGGILKKIIITNPKEISYHHLHSSYSPTRIFYTLIVHGLGYSNIFCEFKRKFRTFRTNYFNFPPELASRRNVDRIEFYIKLLNLMVHVVGVDYDTRFDLGMIRHQHKQEVTSYSLQRLFRQRRKKNVKIKVVGCLRRYEPEPGPHWNVHYKVPFEKGSMNFYIRWDT